MDKKRKVWVWQAGHLAINRVPFVETWSTLYIADDLVNVTGGFGPRGFLLNTFTS